MFKTLQNFTRWIKCVIRNLEYFIHDKDPRLLNHFTYKMLDIRVSLSCIRKRIIRSSIFSLLRFICLRIAVRKSSRAPKSLPRVVILLCLINRAVFSFRNIIYDNEILYVVNWVEEFHPKSILRAPPGSVAK